MLSQVTQEADSKIEISVYEVYWGVPWGQHLWGVKKAGLGTTGFAVATEPQPEAEMSIQSWPTWVFLCPHQPVIVCRFPLSKSMSLNITRLRPMSHQQARQLRVRNETQSWSGCLCHTPQHPRQNSIGYNSLFASLPCAYLFLMLSWPHFRRDSKHNDAYWMFLFLISHCDFIIISYISLL